MSLLPSAGRVSVVAVGVQGALRGPGLSQQLSQQECWGALGVPSRAGPSPGADAVSGRPEPAGLGVLKASAAAVDMVGARRAAIWRLRPPRVHPADVHPAVLQQC